MDQNLITIENHAIRAEINPKGAELQSLYSKQHNQEYMWNADAAYWAKYSPLLFPIVGTLKDNTYHFNGKTYNLPRHGFARDLVFEVEKAETNHATFTLRSSAETKVNYPFDFVLKLHYHIDGTSLEVQYEVINETTDPLYFSIGAHPAFAVPLQENTAYEDYYLEFNKSETAPRWVIENGLIGDPKPLLEDQSKLPLTKKLFYEDALVLKHLESSYVSLLSDKTPRGLQFYFEGFPFLGIWAAKDAPFVCIEPWCGIADSVNHNQKLEEKEGVIALQSNSVWKKAWRVDLI